MIIVAFIIILTIVAALMILPRVCRKFTNRIRKLITNHKYVNCWQIFITVLLWSVCSPLRESGGVHTQPTIELNEDSGSSEMTQHVVVLRGSLNDKPKIPPSLNISSTNLQVSDPIGQGKLGETKLY